MHADALAPPRGALRESIGNGAREESVLASQISFISPTADRVLIVTNPVAGSRMRRETIHDLVVRLNVVGLRAEVIDDLTLLADLIEAHRSAGRLRAVVAAGGDGTLAEVVNRAPHDVPLCVYPLGTANLLAGYFKLECDALALANTLAEGATVQLDAGNANGRIFLSMVGCGFDGEVVQRLHAMRRRPPHQLLDLCPTDPRSHPELSVSRAASHVPGRRRPDDDHELDGLLGVHRQLARLCRRLAVGARGRGNRRPARRLHLRSRFVLARAANTWASWRLANTACWRIARCRGSSACGSNPIPACRISSMAIRAACCRWRSRCCRAGSRWRRPIRGCWRWASSRQRPSALRELTRCQTILPRSPITTPAAACRCW